MTRWKKRIPINHKLRADDCRRHPHMWIEIGLYNGTQSARSTARHIRTAEHLPQYTPAGMFETMTRLTDGGAILYARYTGPAT